MSTVSAESPVSSASNVADTAGVVMVEGGGTCSVNSLGGTVVKVLSRMVVYLVVNDRGILSVT